MNKKNIEGFLQFRKNSSSLEQQEERTGSRKTPAESRFTCGYLKTHFSVPLFKNEK